MQPADRVPRPRPPEETLAALSAKLLFLTEMNWNTTEFAQRDPITLRAAGQMSDILRYVRENDPIESSYASYM